MPAPIINIRPLPPTLPQAPKTPPTREPFPVPFPDNRPPGNRKPNDPDNCPEICVWAKVPTLTPKRIVYTYPSEPSVTVFGETWNTVITSGSYNLLPGVEYRVFWDGTWFSGAPWSVVFNGGAQSFQTVRGNFQITRRCPMGWADGCEVGFTSERGYIAVSFPQSTLVEIPFDRSGSNFWNILTNSFRVTRVVRVSNNQEILPESTCRFRVINSLGVAVVDITRNVCPTVVEIPSQCTYPQEYSLEYKVRKVLTSLKGNPITVETRGNCIDIKQEILSVPPIKVTVKTICSPVGCPPPQYKIDCCEEADCSDKKCPNGTVTRVLIGGKTLQCVDANGCVLREIPYDPKCERYDCIC